MLEFADENSTTKNHAGLNLTLSTSTTSPLQLPDQNQHKLDVGSKVQCGNYPEYGVVKWIGILYENGWLYAGVEMVSIMCVVCMCMCVYVHVYLIMSHLFLPYMIIF